MAKHITSLTQFNRSSRHASYRLGLIDPSTLAPMTVDPLDAPCFKLLVPGPADLPTSLLLDPDFTLGACEGYYTFGMDDIASELGSTPASIANWAFKLFYEQTFEDGSRAWLVGFLLGVFSRLAEVDRVHALVGIAHLSFLLALAPSLPLPQSLIALHDVAFEHHQSVRAYRASVRAYKEAGCDLRHAQCFALAGYAHVNTRYADGSCFLAAPLDDESEVA